MLVYQRVLCLECLGMEIRIGNCTFFVDVKSQNVSKTHADFLEFKELMSLHGELPLSARSKLADVENVLVAT